MKPFNIRVDWVCHDAYGDPVDVELIEMDDNWEQLPGKVIRRESSIPRAVDAAIRWLDQRGFTYLCDVEMHKREGHKHITMHAITKEAFADRAAAQERHRARVSKDTQGNA